ncbi:2-dehydro-3-deoxy-6-phosphogalactonate aldolase [Ideonella sp. YS5]|uniref:2-dehydro-3-deoxy-6-phosphogalactonate aldolase n=1 Tax=Ideonella sp. YS5 TaxID=3453714 RepID=UPI003EED2AAB
MSNLPDRDPGPVPSPRLEAAMARLPLVAILRGLTPQEAPAIGQALVDAGFSLIEVPLNSPRPFESIAALRAALPAEVLLGAGTVMTIEEIAALQAAGGELVVMPHADTALIRAAKAQGLLCIPGVATPTEAFAARAAGADALKLFPAEALPPPVLKAWRAVLPPALRVLPVGGVTPESLAAWRAAGAGGAGLGSALYSPGRSAAEVAVRARAFAQAWHGQAG